MEGGRGKEYEKKERKGGANGLTGWGTGYGRVWNERMPFGFTGRNGRARGTAVGTLDGCVPGWLYSEEEVVWTLTQFSGWDHTSTIPALWHLPSGVHLYVQYHL